jgi:hypothetical protein
MSKTNAVAKTLLSSNGKILDITAAGLVSATFENIESNAKAYREVFISKDLYSSPARLNILSQPERGKTLDVKPWSGNKLPSLSEAIVLRPNTTANLDENVPFKLDPRSINLMGDRLDVRSLDRTVQYPKLK